MQGMHHEDATLKEEGRVIKKMGEDEGFCRL